MHLSRSICDFLQIFDEPLAFTIPTATKNEALWKKHSGGLSFFVSRQTKITLRLPRLTYYSKRTSKKHHTFFNRASIIQVAYLFPVNKQSPWICEENPLLWFFTMEVAISHLRLALKNLEAVAKVAI